MMTFYCAVGSYRLKTEQGHKVPYIQKLGALHPISTLEFLIWTTLLWEVMTYQELKDVYEEQRKGLGLDVPPLDNLLDNLVARKLVMKGVGYTGVDALYNMLANAFVIPYELSGVKKTATAIKLFLKGNLSFLETMQVLRASRTTADEARVIDLIRQTPLSTAELVRCFDLNLRDVSTVDKLLAGLYPDENSDQAHIANEEIFSQNTTPVLQAVANLYLDRKVILEYA